MLDDNRIEPCSHKWGLLLGFLPDGVMEVWRHCVHCDAEELVGSWLMAGAAEDE